MSFLIDTSVISELVRKSPHPPVLEWLGAQDESALFLSVITIGELEKGIARLPASSRKSKLQAWVRRDLAGRFGERLLPVDIQVAARWGALTGESEKRGEPLPVIDSLIAATAQVHGLAVVTRNVKDFKRCGVSCVNPWDQ